MRTLQETLNFRPGCIICNSPLSLQKSDCFFNNNISKKSNITYEEGILNIPIRLESYKLSPSYKNRKTNGCISIDTRTNKFLVDLEKYNELIPIAAFKEFNAKYTLGGIYIDCYCPYDNYGYKIYFQLDLRRGRIKEVKIDAEYIRNTYDIIKFISDNRVTISNENIDMITIKNCNIDLSDPDLIDIITSSLILA